MTSASEEKPFPKFSLPCGKKDIIRMQKGIVEILNIDELRKISEAE
jgi:hypothetical protein